MGKRSTDHHRPNRPHAPGTGRPHGSPGDGAWRPHRAAVRHRRRPDGARPAAEAGELR